MGRIFLTIKVFLPLFTSYLLFDFSFCISKGVSLITYHQLVSYPQSQSECQRANSGVPPPRGCSKSPQKRPFLGVEGGTIFEVTVRKYLGDFFPVFLPFLGGSFTRIFSPIFFPDKPSKILHFSMHFPALGGLISSTLSGKYKGPRFRRFFSPK